MDPPKDAAAAIMSLVGSGGPDETGGILPGKAAFPAAPLKAFCIISIACVGEGMPPEGTPRVEWFKASCMFMSWRDVIISSFNVSKNLVHSKNKKRVMLFNPIKRMAYNVSSLYHCQMFSFIATFVLSFNVLLLFLSLFHSFDTHIPF